MKVILSLALTLGFFSLTACNSGSTGDPYYVAWYDAFGRPCGYSMIDVHPGCNYYSNGSKILAWQDPFWSQWPRNGQPWMSPSGVWYDPNGYAINSDLNSAEISADVITQAAEQQNEIVRLAGKSLSQEYALSESISIRIAQSLDRWATLGQTRTRTEADIADFSQRLYGLRVEQIKTAMNRVLTERNLQPLEELNIDVAAYWGTSPEVSKMILKKWHQGELSRLTQ